MRHFSIYAEIYKTNLLVVGDCTPTELQKFVKRKYKVDISDIDPEISLKAGAVLDLEGKWPYTVIYVRKLSRKPEDFSVLVHELFHFVLRVCADKNIPTYGEMNDKIMDEAAAYLMEFYAREAMLKLLGKTTTI